MKGAEAAKTTGSVTPMPAKPGLKEPPAKDEAEENAAKTPAVPSAKFLPTGLSRAIVIGSILIAFTLSATDLFAGRYQLVPSPNAENNYVYRLDSLTGRVGFCSPAQCTVLNEAVVEK